MVLGCASIGKNKTTLPQVGDAAEIAEAEASAPSPAAAAAAATFTPATTVRTGRPPDQSIFKAAARGEIDVLRRFSDEGGSLDVADSQGLTLLMFACRRGQIEVARYLLQTGANVDAIDRDQTAVIHYASENPNREIARLVLQAGADASVTDRFGYNTLLKWAERADWNLIEEALSRPERLKQLEELRTALEDAAKQAGQTKILEALKKIQTNK